MTARWRRTAGLLPLLAALVLPGAATAQEWTLGVAAGQTVFDPLSSRIGTNHLTATLRYDALRDLWIQGAAAAPLRSGDPAWTVAGGGGHLALASSRGGGAAVGIDLAGQGYLFRDPVVARTGTGAAVDAKPVLRLTRGATRVDLRGGWRGHVLDYAGVTERRGVVETGARVTHGRRFRLGADTRIVRAPEGLFPFAAATVSYAGPALHAWAQAGRWLDDRLDDPAWNAGVGYAVHPRVTVWTTIREDGRDPLYWNSARRSWTVGLTTTLRRGAAALPIPAPVRTGTVVIRVPADEVPGSELWLAGTFNGWQPVPMLREGRAWVLRLPLDPGVYRYAFRRADGTWFVPASIEGRRDDGMGGHVAVMVVG